MKSKLLLSICAILLLLLVAVAAASIWIPHHFLGSEAFRQQMNRHTAQTLKLQGEWMPFRLKGWTLSSDGYEASGTFGSARVHIRAEQLSFRVRWRSLIHRTWRIDPVEVQKLDIRIISLADSTASQPDPLPSPPAPPGKLAQVAALFIPRTVEIEEILLPDTRIHWTTLDNQQFELAGIKSTTISDGAGGWSTSVASGVFTPPDRLIWNLNSARLVGDLKEMSLDHAEWFGADSGVIKLSGTLLQDGALNAELQVEGRAIPATSLVPENWKSFVEGSVDTDTTAYILPASTRLEGEVTGKNIRLIGVPALRSLQLATGIREWTELPLDTAWMKFSYRTDDLQIPSSVFESKGLSRLEGNLSVRDRQLSGTYQVGLTNRTISRIPGARHSVFTLEQNGYFWAQPAMTLSGTSSQPKEDLSPRLKSALFDAVEKKVNESVDQGLNILNSILDAVPR